MKVRGYPVHFGVQLQAQGTTWPAYAEAVQAVEALGFGSVWTFDHMLPFSGPDNRACFETLTTLSAMAMLTSRARIGVLVNGVLYRDPATLAKAAAQVDNMTGGRLDFSLGAAWAEREFKAYGLAFPPLPERYTRLDEALSVVKLLWSEERANFQGRYYQLDDAPCEPKPVQKPHPPIMIGGSGRGSLRMAAVHADRLNVIGSPGDCAKTAAALEQQCAKAGRDPMEIELSVHPTLALAHTAKEAEDLAALIESRLNGGLPPEVPPSLAGPETGLSPQPRSVHRANWLVGTPSDVAEGTKRYFDAGISHFVFGLGHPFDLAPLRLFQEEVVPALN